MAQKLALKNGKIKVVCMDCGKVSWEDKQHFDEDAVEQYQFEGQYESDGCYFCSGIPD